MQWDCRRFTTVRHGRRRHHAEIECHITAVLIRPLQGDIDQHEVSSQLLCGGSLRDIGDWWRRRCLNVRLSRQILEPVLDRRVVLVVN